MRRLTTYLLLILATAFFNVKGQNNVNTGSSKLIPIDFSDSNYVDVAFYAKDTITADGWTIKYMVKDDSTRYSDIYIQWSKDNRGGLFYGESILLMRRYFVPFLVGENKTHIYLEHGCATGCRAILTLSKDSFPKDNDYNLVIEYNIKNGQILYCKDYSNLDTMKVVIVDLKRNKEKTITFENVCYSTPMTSCIDNVILERDYVKLSATLYNRKDKDKLVKEEYNIKLEN